MVKIEYDKELFDPRNPLIPVVDARRYTEVLKELDLPEGVISDRTVVVSSRVVWIRQGLRRSIVAGTYNPQNAGITVYPGAFYRNYLRSLALSDPNLSRDLADKKTTVLLTVPYVVAGTLAGVFLGPETFSNYPVEVYMAAGVILGSAGVLGGAFVNEPLVYTFGLTERRARQFQNNHPVELTATMVTTVVNPECDLDYEHQIADKNPRYLLNITNRELLDLKG